MAATIYEMQETRGFSESSGKLTATRKFAVWDEASAITQPATIRELFGGGSLPEIGDLFPGETDIYAISYDIRHMPNSRNIWEVEFRYENTEPGEKQPQEPGYTEFSIDYSVEFRDMYRARPNLSIPQFGTPTLNDIGGTKIDAGGRPLSVMVKITNLTIGETVLSNTLPARSEVIRLLRGRRNNTVFYGAPIGQVLYLGASSSRIALDKYTLQHKFAVDEYSHLIQNPTLDHNREVVIEAVNGINRAAKVLFVQPFPDFGDFNQLSENF
jgi:hypothetical protein